MSDLARLKRHIGMILLTLCLVGAGLSWLPSLPSQAIARDLPREALTIEAGGVRSAFQVELANTDDTRAQGLMYRKKMAADEGMLFDFRATEPVYFWMKNTYLSLDMIFITEDGTIAAIAENTVPLSEKVVPSGTPVRFVLEVIAGTAKRLGLKPGDRVTHRLMTR